MELYFILATLILSLGTVRSQDGPDSFSRLGSISNQGNVRPSSSRFEQRCSKTSREFTTESMRFLKCITGNIQNELDHVKTSKYSFPEMQRYKLSEQARYKQALDVNSCPSGSINKDLKSFLRDDMKMSPIVYNDIYENLNIIIWESAKEPVLSQCFLDFLRDRFMAYLKRETGSAIPTSAREGLPSVPVPDDQRYNLEMAKEMFDLRIRAYLLAFNCRRTTSFHSGSEGAIKKMSEKYTHDTCKCAQRSFRDCAGIVKGESGLCGEVRRAILNIPQRAGSIATAAEVGNQAKHCWNNFKESAFGRTRRVRLGDLAVYGIKLVNAFGKLTAQDRLDFLEMIQGFLEAHFSADFCSSDTCRY